jgi:hypothetical protein
VKSVAARLMILNVPTRLSAAFLICCSLWLPAAPQGETLEYLFARYLSGDYTVDAGLRALPASVILDELPVVSKKWFARYGAPAGLRRAERRAAAFAVEAAYASIYNGGLKLQPRQRRDSTDPPNYVQGILRWAREQLIRRPGSDSFHRRWYHAVIAVVEAAQLAESVDQWSAEALRTFPREPRFVLSRAVAVELRGSQYAGSSAHVSSRTLDEAVPRFTAAMAFEATRSEAQLRLGNMYAGAGEQMNALKSYQDAQDHAGDRSLMYLARLFTGRLKLDLDLTGAEKAFRDCLDIVPGAQSATIGLATVRFRQHDQLEATRLVDSALAATEIVADPYWVYWIADAAAWPEIVRLLRLELQW